MQLRRRVCSACVTPHALIGPVCCFLVPPNAAIKQDTPNKRKRRGWGVAAVTSEVFVGRGIDPTKAAGAVGVGLVWLVGWLVGL